MPNSYNPTTTELKSAISSFLNEKTQVPSAKTVKEHLQHENPTWRIPERRVLKFLKQGNLLSESARNGGSSNDVSNSSVKKGFKGLYKGAKKLFVPPNKSSKGNNPQGPPTDLTMVSTTPVPITEVTVADKHITAEVDNFDADVTKEESIYKDDNDGKKDNACVPCEGCILM